MAREAVFNARKAAQVIAYFAWKAPGKRLNVVKAVKLVYLADRTSISCFGFPILDGDDHVSMPHGPVNSTTYRFINGEREDLGWSEFLQDRENHEVAAKADAADSGWDELSDADLQCLDKVWKDFGHMNQWDLVAWTHEKKNVPEWEDPEGSSSSIPMSRILTMLKIENAEEQEAALIEMRHFDKVFKSIGKK